jgi:DNA-binding GntR family transcriptional regulator
VAVGQLDRGKDAWLQHRAILVAIRDGNPKEARRAALFHVRKSKQLAMLRLQEEAEYFKHLRVVG